ncbi:MAG TPA: hypothetical protein PLK94_03055 [Alphaproteobacteria bacterium]|nr:hypothetical protein [Alphaproteobacteria bacterium]MCB9985034.1 hypothetical protein [Micavibrio sp.]HOO50248.1 hypothetical protein [Alphaproteobacteria bacterium]
MQAFNKTRFQQAYQIAMAEQAPQMYRELIKTKALKQHLQETAEEAQQMYDYTVKHLKSTQGMSHTEAGLVAAEIVFADMIQFPQ